MSEEEAQPNHPVLKTIVILLGIAILVMTGIIVYTAIDRFSGAETDEVVTDNPVPAVTGASWTHLTEPRTIESAGIDGQRVLVTTVGAEGRKTVQILDARTGRLIGTITDR